MHFVHLLTAIAILFLGALLGGRMASSLRLPRVTGYLLAGLIVGPSFAGLAGLPPLVAKDALVELRLVSDLALALILMNIGGQFRTDLLRRWRHRILLFSLSEILTTAILVALVCGLANQFVLRQTLPGLTLLASSSYIAILLGLIGIATAPAATLMVIREYEASGPVTSAVLTLVGLNNLLAVLGFAVASHFLINPGEGLALLAARTIGPLILGGGLGFVLSVWGQRLELESEFKILLLGGVAAAAGLCKMLDFDFLLGCFALGMVLANSSPRWHRMLEALRQVDYPLYVAFFVLAGANLHLETLGHIGLLGICYVLARTTGKWLGAHYGARLGRFGERERQYVGMTLLAQAGVAIGLAASLARSWPAGGHLIETIVLGSVVVFELIGPLAVRFGLVRAGEVPILSLLQKRAPQGAVEGMHNVVQHFRSSLGLPAGHNVSHPGDILVRHIMRQNVETIRNDTRFNELLRLISHSRYDRFPVIDGKGHFVGMINYTEIRNLLFEPSLASLVVASDLVSASPCSVSPDQPLREALKLLQQHQDISFFPVLAADDQQHLLGILNQNDVLAAFRRFAKE
jgi:Kef-type K+ transport system membrane component KefB/CBS domain-containing protein